MDSIENLKDKLEAYSYVSDYSLVTALFVSFQLKKPILIEGEAGVGKTEVAKVLSEILQTRLIRLQCYEGLDVNHALYEWDYKRQMIQIRLSESRNEAKDNRVDSLFSPEFLLRRPLLDAIDHKEDKPVVLLIDEIDRADEEFEAFLLEILSDFQVSIPEMGTIRAKHIPYVILTSNRTRQLSDALKRRCIYHWIEYPPLEKEMAIVQARVPEASPQMAKDICQFMQWIRKENLGKVPGVAETIDWLRSLLLLDVKQLERANLEATIGCLLKDKEDIDRFLEDFNPEIFKKIGVGR